MNGLFNLTTSFFATFPVFGLLDEHAALRLASGSDGAETISWVLPVRDEDQVAFVFGQRQDDTWDFHLSAFAFRPAHLASLFPEVMLVRALEAGASLSITQSVALERVLCGQQRPDAALMTRLGDFGARLQDVPVTFSLAELQQAMVQATHTPPLDLGGCALFLP